MNGADNGWREAVLPINATIREAVSVLNNIGLKIVLVLDSEEALLGTILDGDIRRGLLKGLELSSPIETIVHREALVVARTVSRSAVRKLMSDHKIQQIPITDEKGRVVGLHLWDEIGMPTVRPNIMVIMAGGKGTRLHPQTENCPKPLLPVAGKPILEHIIDRAKMEGFRHFILAIYYLGHMIEDYFQDGKRFGVTIEYLREELPLGTAGALSLLELRPDLPFVVTNGDVLTGIRYGEMLDFHLEQNAMATMAVRWHEWQNPFGVVETDGIDIVGYSEKPISRTHINAGVYVIEPSALDFLTKSTPYDMPSLFELIKKNSLRVVAYPIHEQWLDVGRPDDLREAGTLNYLNYGETP